MPLKFSVGVGVLAITMFVYVISLAVWIATLKTGENSVRLVADQHRAEVARATRDRIDDQLGAAETLTATNALMFSNGAYQHPDRPDPRGAETAHFLTAFRSQLLGSRFITTVSMTDRRGNLFGVYTNFDFTFFGMWEQFANASNNNSPTLLDHETYPEGHAQEGQKRRFIGATPDYNSSQEVWYTVVDVTKKNSSAWTPMYSMGNEGEVTTMLSQSHAIFNPSGSLIGVTSIDMATGFVGATLNQVGHKDMLTFCVDAFENALLGTSKNDPIMRCKKNVPLSQCPPEEQAFMKPSESANAEVESVTAALMARSDNDWKNVESSQFESGDFLIDVKLVIKNNLRWVVVVVVPQSTILAETRENTKLMIAMQTVCGVLQIILSIIFAWLIRRPLANLINQMEALKQFRTDDTDDKSRSVFSEINHMQEGHESLRVSMDRVKSFVPQSVLAELTGAVDEDEEQDEGTVTGSVVTEIKSNSKSASNTRGENASVTASVISGSSGGGGGGIAALKAGAITHDVTSRRVSILVCNVRHFHDRTVGASGEVVKRTMEELVTNIMSITKKHRGMLDYFQGDHFVFSFNAVSNNASHSKNSVLTAMQCVEAVGHLKEKFEMHCGVSSSECSIGNMGSSEVKRFGIIGPAFSQAVMLEKMCRRYKGVNILTIRRAFTDCEGTVLMQAVDVVNIPNRTRIYVPRVSQEHGATQEWMYDMQESPYNEHNKKFDEFLMTEVTPACPPPEITAPVTPEELLESLVSSNVDGKTYARAPLAIL